MWAALAPSVQDAGPGSQKLPCALPPNTPAVSEEDVDADAPALPLQVPGIEQAVSGYQRVETLESWKLLSDSSCADYALAVLETLHAQDLELEQAGFMDVSGECWGCVFTGSDGEALSITLIPERPFSPRSDSNLLVVNVLHYLEPEDFA